MLVSEKSARAHQNASAGERALVKLDSSKVKKFAAGTSEMRSNFI
jgi:hypothetical protein